MSRAELRVLWEREFAGKAPATLGRDILALGIAYARQERRYGGLAKPVAKELDRLLARVLRDDATDAPSLQRQPLPRTGTILVREWRGTTHQVTVVDEGFLWNGKTYRSLSSIARAITGTNWNGPRFFGMREVKEQGRRRAVAANERKILRCAIYTRKSSEHGLEQDFNSLDAQREACEAYIKSQAHEGWKLVKTQLRRRRLLGRHTGAPGPADAARGHPRPQDRRGGGLQGRPADPLAGRLCQAGRAVRGHGVSFVSVTQQFNTTTSMGRLTLNVLLSFAQFEREVAGERIRDKIAASRRKGMWMGGTSPARLRRQGQEARRQCGRGRTGPADLRRYLRSAASRSCGRLEDRHPEQAARLDIRQVRRRQLLRPGCALLPARNRIYRRRGGPQGQSLSRRARADHGRRAVGVRSRQA